MLEKFEGGTPPQERKEEVKWEKEYRPRVGDHISEVAERMVAIAKEEGVIVKTRFSDVILTAKPDDNPEDIVKQYDAELQRFREERENSPESKNRNIIEQ